MKFKGIIICVLLIFLCSCSKNSSQSSSNTEDEVKTKSYSPDAVAVADAIDVSRIDEVRDSISNIEIKDFTYAVPSELKSVYGFYRSYYPRKKAKEQYDEFVNTFNIIYPDHEYNEGAVHFVGSRWFNANEEDASDPPLYADYKNEIESGSEDVLYYFYDYYRIADKEKYDKVFLEFITPAGSDLFRFNRGKAAKLHYESVGESVGFLELLSPDLYGTYVTSLEPDSTEEYQLADGKCKVCDAVAFFENYLNNLEMGTEASCNIKVVDVEVYSVTDSIYSFLFICTAEYKGLLFDYRNISAGLNNTDSSLQKTSPILSMGSMVYSDEVDFLYNYPRFLKLEDVEEYDKIIPVEKAVKYVGENMSDNVTFELKGVELVYLINGKAANDAAIENNRLRTDAVWKTVLYNSNDQRTYYCYFDAVDGSNFRYTKG